ncbi:efflux RND transporter permease subunit [Vulgatibacter sp.]|uniref:efflux RND transporter permease subunit n=1 Tax=Vulgatibacter sp. TaxID=1971226 RepID=UPI00356A82B8
MDPIKTFITRPVFTTMLVAAFVVFGMFAYPRIGVDQFPEVEFPVVTVLTVMPGADPATMEQDVSDPLEESINTLSGLETLRSVNVESVSQVVVQFDLDKDPDIAAQEVRDKVQATLRDLPQEIETPVVEKFDIGAAPVMTFALAGPVPVEELTRLADDVVKPALQQKAGVGAVDIVGGRERQIQIEIDPDRLRGYGLAASDVVAAVQAQSIEIPGGRTAEAARERTIKLTSEAKSADQIRELIIPAPTPSPVRIRDVANVIDGPEEARSAARFMGESAVALQVKKQSGANTVAVADELKSALASVQSQLPEGAVLSTVSDNSRFIRSSIEGVQHDMIIGGLLAVVIVLLFLRNGRSTIISAVALPVSVIGTFAVIEALGFTFNIITMLALTLSIGLLIDDAIVVIENVVRHMEEGKSPFRAAWEGTKEIALAVLAVTLSIVAVFVPVAFMEGIMGKFFYQFGITVAVSVIISFFVSLTLTPMLSAKLLRHHGEGGKISQAIERVLRSIESFYKVTLRWMLTHRAAMMGLASVVLVGTVMLAGMLKATFIPEQDRGEFKVSVELPVGSNLELTQSRVRDLAAQLEAVPGVANVFTTVGAGAQEEVHKGEILVALQPLAQRGYKQQELMRWARESLVRSADTTIGVQEIAAVGGGHTQQVQLNIRSNDYEALGAAAEKLGAVMKAKEGFVDVDSTYRPGKPQIDVQLDRERAAAVGIPAASVGQTLRALLGGDKVGDIRMGNETYDVVLKLPEAVRADAGSLGSLTMRSATGQLVELRSIADLEESAGPSQIDRQARMRQVTMLANLDGMSLSEAMTFLQHYAATELPQGVVADFEGNAKQLADAGKAFGLALLLAIVLLYMILAAQFESFIDPLTIMMSLPFAVIGAIGGLLIAGQEMSMFAMIGIIMLMGLVAKNGILLVDFTNQLRREGKSVFDALMEAGPLRLRPILMTTIAMIGGMVPVAMARGDGAETRVPMAIAIIGGLVTSTVLTLGIVPVVYSLFEGAKARVDRVLKRKPRPVEAHEDLAA